jgi:hypothetical protein
MLLNEGSLTVAVVNVVGRAADAAALAGAPEEDAADDGVPEDDVAEDLQAASIRTRSRADPHVRRVINWNLLFGTGSLELYRS